jgi:hypothetical protein
VLGSSDFMKLSGVEVVLVSTVEVSVHRQNRERSVS